MEYLVVAFRSRTHTVKFSEYLRRYGINNEIVNTPKQAGVGCGLSVKVSTSLFSIVKKAVFSVNLSSFAGFFLVTVYRNQIKVRSI